MNAYEDIGRASSSYVLRALYGTDLWRLGWRGPSGTKRRNLILVRHEAVVHRLSQYVYRTYQDSEETDL
jgi:hypothetical protein